MAKRVIIPKGSEAAVRELKMSPAVVAGDHIYLTGVTGSGPDGAMPEEPEAQFRAAFRKIGAVLREAGLDFDAVVEMTSYHLSLRDHFPLFDTVRLEIFESPYPAWTAVEVAGLRRPGALVEIRIVAQQPTR